MTEKIIKEIEKDFALSLSDMRRIIRNFLLEMDKGLEGKKSSLKMIPTYVDRPTGDEIGRFIALDLGGTNFRILELKLKGKRGIPVSKVMRFSLKKEYITGEGKKLFDFIAGCMEAFLKANKISEGEELNLGFTFSFPVKQTAVAAGKLVCWTKGFSARGVIGEDVVKLLNEAFMRKGIYNIKISALANDTVGTLVAGSYRDGTCDVGVIIGTGTNACYTERLENIKKDDDLSALSGRMIINTEWGNFNKFRMTGYDRILDKNSDNPGSQILEKMVSGMYLGELCRLALGNFKNFRKLKSLKSEDISVIEGDLSGRMERSAKLFRSLGVRAEREDLKTARRVCAAISKRASRISAAAISAIVLKMDPGLSRRHTVAIDGSVYEKHPHFSGNIRSALKEMFGRRANNIKIRLAKDGSGEGAAIIAAVAAS